VIAIPIILAAAALLVGSDVASGATVVTRYEPAEGLVRIGPEPGRQIPRVDRGTALVLPDGRARGVVIWLDGWPPDPEALRAGPGGFDELAIDAGLAVVRRPSGDPLDFYSTDDVIAGELDAIDALLAEHGLDEAPRFLLGMSLAGTRALRMTIHAVTHGRRVPAAVAVVDAPIDMIRFWHAERLATARDFHPSAADEGRWVRYRLEQNLGGTPADAREAYVAYSPYTHGEPEGGQARHLAGIPLRAYHEPDVDWWIAHRQKSYYAMNSLDLAALVTELQHGGHPDAALITTHAARPDLDGSPHSWSIVDEPELLRWLLGHLPADAPSGSRNVPTTR